MKKILITGMTPKQVGRSKSTWITWVDALKFILKQDDFEDYEIEHRNVIPGENLDGYHKVIVFIAPHDSIAAGYRWGGLWAIAHRPDAIISVDDWQYFTIQNKLKSALAAGRFYRFVDKLPEWSREEEVNAIKKSPDVRTRIASMALEMSKRIVNANILMPLFPWYDKSEIGFECNKDNVIPIDPSNFIGPNAKIEVGIKEKRWVIGSLFDHSNYVRKMNLTWPVKMYGHKKTQIVLSEYRLCEEYAKSYGVIAPLYRTSGDGWWRMRYAHCMHYKAYLLLDRQESYRMSPAFHYLPKQIEAFNDETLAKVIDFQGNWLRTHFESKESVVDKLLGVLK